MALTSSIYISVVNGSVGRNCSSSCLPQERQAKGFGDKTRVLFIHMNLSPLLQDFHGGDLLRVICILGTLLKAELHWNFKSSEFDCLQARSGRKCSWVNCLYFSLAVPVSRLHIYLTSVESRAFYMDGIQTRT